MPRIALAAGVVGDFDRILDHLEAHEVADAPSRINAIIEAIQVLETSPYIGRPADEDRRELIIGRGSRGYVALYRYVTELDIVIVLAVRSQREAGYR
ncbi:MAG TPA: type II toxin-antitoxin system RelE/ParE family toxin [Kofleriaceae bacterium]|jgi:plasmid stabilization system protein ParE